MPDNNKNRISKLTIALAVTGGSVLPIIILCIMSLIYNGYFFPKDFGSGLAFGFYLFIIIPINLIIWGWVIVCWLFQLH
jgi:hypothetical protein